jgi:4-deoxy-L-threo-5-hexosulose-uronate ketol-isomerase
MKMDLRTLPTPESYSRMTTAELRAAFVLGNLFVPGKVSMVYCDADRAIVGGAVPARAPLPLLAGKKEMAAAYFAERREIGVVNIGGPGTVAAGGKAFKLKRKDMLYIGRGTRSVVFGSDRQNDPARFYFVSFPAHAACPTKIARAADAEKSDLGSDEGANRRTINKYIHPGGVGSCQLVMGLTDLAPGSVWNTMPPHTHLRRMEVYLYFNIDSGSAVVHLMGSPGETRSLIMRNGEAVISPAWSIHCGAGTRNYSFVWAMGGENQEFSDMDAVPVTQLY